MRTDPPIPSPKPRVHVGVFDDVARADHALAELVGAGIPKEQITVICPTCTAEKYREFHRRSPSGAPATPPARTGGSGGAPPGGVLGGPAVTRWGAGGR